MPSAQGHITVRRKAKDGLNGRGVTIASTSIMYATGTSGTTAPTSGWQSNVPAVTDGLYLWARTHISFSDGTELNIYSVSRMGIDGKGIQSSVVTYSLQANPVDPTAITDWGGFPSTLTDGYWLYTKTHVVYSDSSSTDSYSVSQVGTGSYYAGCQEYYAVSPGKTTAPAGYPNAKPFVDGVATYVNGEIIGIGSAWSTSRPDADLTSPYIWNFEISYDSRGNKYVTQPICIGNFSRGIVSIVETYTVSSHAKAADMLADETERSDHPWEDEEFSAVPNADKPYQWNRTVVNYNDGSPDTFYHISAIRGNDVTGVQEQYARSSSNTTPPASTSSSWKDNPRDAIPTAANKYLWNRERLCYSDGTYSDWTTPAVIGTYSKDGKSITGVTEYYLASSESSGVTRSRPDWTTYPTSENAIMTPTKRYLWNYESISWSEGNNTYTDPIVIGVYGEQGAKGDKGDEGEKGDRGLDGCILRVSEWAEGVEYRNDEALTVGTRYLDIAVVTTGATTFNAYKCLRTHTSSSATPVSNTYYWQPFDGLLPIYTPLIMAQHALLRFAQTNQLLVMKGDGTTVAAGLGGGNGAPDEDNFPLWVGGTTPAAAPFKVRIDGKMFATGAEISGKIIASSGNIGPFTIGDGGLYCGNTENWKSSGNNFAYLHESAIRIGQKISYSGNEIASLKVFIGKDSDPDVTNADLFCDTAMYIYRKMNSGAALMREGYKPAVKIISDNVGIPNVALRLDGALQAHGGVIEKGYYLYYTGEQPYHVNTFNLTLGTTFLVKCTTTNSPKFYLPALSDVRMQLGLDYTPFCVRLTILACKGTKSFVITASSPIYNHNGNQWGSNDWTMEQGDVAIVCLCYDGSDYFIQEIDTLE